MQYLFTFLGVVAVMNQDEVVGLGLLSEADEVHEGALLELVNSDLAQPHEETVVDFVQDTGELPQTLLAVQTHSRVKFVHLELILVDVEHLH